MRHSVLRRLIIWGNLVRFSHSIFALPFAGVMFLTVIRSYPFSWRELGLLLLCVVSARTAAMAFNRLVDSKIDARNNRTKGREIPSGKVSRGEVVVVVALSALVFISASLGLGLHCGALSLPVLVVILGYSWIKRFSVLCHLVLGLSLALAPGGVWYALTASWSWQPVPLMISVALWVAGFDILYACQDTQFDKEEGLFSVPSRFGIVRARWFSVGLHILSVLSLFLFGANTKQGLGFWLGAGVFSALVASQHWVVVRRGFKSIDQVFFLRNGLASLLLFIGVLIDALFTL